MILMKMNKIGFMVLLLILTACKPHENEETIENENNSETSIWRAVIHLNDSTELPFNFEWSQNDTNSSFTIFNGDEKVISNSMEIRKDSLVVGFPVFANYFILKIHESSLNGYFVNPDKKQGKLKLSAEKNIEERFYGDKESCCDINEKWAVRFSPNTADEYPAIAYFTQEGNSLKGTFLTETGDYRYLEGNISGNNLNLSTFDGAHLFLFTGKLMGQKIKGNFYSGGTWFEPWTAKRDDKFDLRHSDSLTYLKEGFKTLDFSFPNSKGEMVGIEDDEYKNKPVIVQLMGSWCPNCMDESRYLKTVYDEYNSKGLEIISLAFERMKNEKTAFRRVGKLQEDLDLPYQILLAGSANKKEAAKALPMLNHIMSYPTAIYLNKDHEIVKIHTGFSGPGTPLYENYVKENRIFLDELVK